MSAESPGLNPDEQSAFEALVDQPEMQGLAALDADTLGKIYDIPTPFDNDRINAENTTAPRMANTGEYDSFQAQTETHRNSAERFNQLIDQNIAVGPALNRVRQSAFGGGQESYGLNTIGGINHEMIVDKIPDPAELADNIAEYEQRLDGFRQENPGFDERIRERLHRNILEAADRHRIDEDSVAELSLLDAEKLNDAYESIMTGLYGDRWQAVKEQAGVENFGEWAKQRKDELAHVAESDEAVPGIAAEASNESEGVELVDETEQNPETSNPLESEAVEALPELEFKEVSEELTGAERAKSAFKRAGKILKKAGSIVRKAVTQPEDFAKAGMDHMHDLINREEESSDKPETAKQRALRLASVGALATGLMVYIKTVDTAQKVHQEWQKN